MGLTNKFVLENILFQLLITLLMSASPRFLKPFAGTAVLALLAACGGSDGGAPTDPAPTMNPAPVLKLSGVAAVGEALATARVSVKCASGAGETSTDVSGRYTLSLTNGSLPCAIQVLSEADGLGVRLHSVAEEGAVNGTETSAVANVTPVTEMIVAHLTGGLPTEVFESFLARQAITTPELALATSAVVNALKTGTGIDLSAIDPFKAALVAPSAENTAGNAHDQLLEQLGEKLSLRTLGTVVAQIAYAAKTESAGTSTEATTLADVMAAVNAGPMPYCPHVINGKYRVLEYTGRTHVARLDFKNLRYDHPDGTPLGTMAALNPDEPCEFTVSGAAIARSVTATFAMGTQGGGMFRAASNTTSATTVGHIFPVQVHSQGAGEGAWTLLQSGRYQGGWQHTLSRLAVGKNGEATLCDYESIQNTSCGSSRSLLIAGRADGSYTTNIASGIDAQAWMYKAPNGRETLFGSMNPTGDATALDQRHFVGSRPVKLNLPSLNSVVRYTEALLSLHPTYGTLWSKNAVTYTAVDAATSTVTRQQQSGGRIDQVRYDFPIDGVRFRPGGTSSTTTGGTVILSDVLQFPLGTATVAINAAPVGTPQSHFYAIGVNRP